MARLLTEGFEMGDALGFDVGDGSASTTARTGVYSWNLSNAGCRKNLDDLTEVYTRVAFRRGNFTSGRDVAPIMFYNGDTTLAHIRLDDLNVVPYITTTAQETIFTIVQSVWYLLEVYFKLDSSVGRFVVKINGIEYYNFTGNTDPSSLSVIDNFRTRQIAAGGATVVDDIAINDTSGAVDNSWCGDGRIVLIKPNAAGDNNDFINSDGADAATNYTFVNEIPSDGDTTYVYPSTDPVGEYDLYNLTAPSLPSNAVITHVWGEARAKAPTTDYGVAIRLRGTTDTDGDTTYLGTAYQQLISGYYSTNDESEPWEETDVDDLQAGVVIK